MKVNFSNFSKNEADLIVVPVASESKPNIPADLEKILDRISSSGKFKSKSGDIYSTAIIIENQPKEIIFLGLGKEADIEPEKIRISMAKAVKKARELEAQKVYIDTEGQLAGKHDSPSIVKAIVEGICLGDYKFDKYKSEKTKKGILEFCLGKINENSVNESSVKEAEILAEATNFARDLVNEPPNVLYPDSLAEIIKGCAKEFGYEAQILCKKEIEEMGMKAFLAVSEGSANEPRFIIMRYFGDKNNSSDILGLVGKGLTFDAGGNNLKPGDSMTTMKSDMAGAAAVIGAINAISKARLKVNVVAVIAACENLLSGKAYKPGDIIGSMAGKTIEVLNTDAEGRLTLADGVYYIAEKEKAAKVVDIATLTGAALVVLGTTATPAVTNDEKLYEEYLEASKESGEKVWLLPSFDEYKEVLKSDIADLKNVSGRNAGTITGGLFMGEFVKDKPWLHLDIAGTSWAEADKDYYSKGGTGVGVRSLYYLAKNYSNLPI